MKKGFHIWNFSNKKISLRLNNALLSKMKEDIYQKFGSFYKFGRRTGITSYGLIHQAFEKNSLPLYLVENIMENTKQNKRDIENSISAYKAYGGRKWIKEPKLPIIESPQLYELVGHVLGDGHISVEKGKTSGYTNKSKELISEFQRLVNEVFGKIKLNVYIDKRFNTFQAEMPRPISLFLSEKFPNILSKQTPKIPPKYAPTFLRAIADDESCVCTSEIKFIFKKKSALKYIRILLLRLGFKNKWITNVRERGNLYSLSIKGRGLIYFNSVIKFKHPDKIKQLHIEIKRKTKKQEYKRGGERKREITKMLVSPKTPKEISNTTGIEVYKVREHLKNLQKSNHVKITGFSKYNVPLWVKIKDYKTIHKRREEKILKLLKKRKLCTRRIAEKLKLSKDTLLRYLHKLEKTGKIKHRTKGRTYFWGENENRKNIEKISDFEGCN